MRQLKTMQDWDEVRAELRNYTINDHVPIGLTDLMFQFLGSYDVMLATAMGSSETAEGALKVPFDFDEFMNMEQDPKFGYIIPIDKFITLKESLGTFCDDLEIDAEKYHGVFEITKSSRFSPNPVTVRYFHTIGGFIQYPNGFCVSRVNYRYNNTHYRLAFSSSSKTDLVRSMDSVPHCKLLENFTVVKREEAGGVLLEIV